MTCGVTCGSLRLLFSLGRIVKVMLEQLRLNQTIDETIVARAAVCLVRPSQFGNSPLPNWADVKPFLSQVVRDFDYWRKKYVVFLTKKIPHPNILSNCVVRWHGSGRGAPAPRCWAPAKAPCRIPMPKSDCRMGYNSNTLNLVNPSASICENNFLEENYG
jgi:hypothetical protein